MMESAFKQESSLEVSPKIDQAIAKATNIVFSPNRSTINVSMQKQVYLSGIRNFK